MSLIAYRHPKNGTLHSTEYAFIHYMEEKYPKLSYNNILAIDAAITSVINNEFRALLFSIPTAEKISPEHFERLQKYKYSCCTKALDEIKRMQELHHTVHLEHFIKKDNDFNTLLYLFGHSVKLTDPDLTRELRAFPVACRKNRELLRTLAIEIFDSIHEATIRVLKPESYADLTEEEKEDLTSTNRVTIHSKIGQIKDLIYYFKRDDIQLTEKEETILATWDKKLFTKQLTICQKLLSLLIPPKEPLVSPTPPEEKSSNDILPAKQKHRVSFHIPEECPEETPVIKRLKI